MASFVDVAGNDPASARYRVVAALRGPRTISRAQLARKTGLAPSTITSLVHELLSEGVVHEGDVVDEAGARPGPRSRGLTVNPGLGTVVGIDFGFRTVRVLVADVAGRQLAFEKAPLPEAYNSGVGLQAATDLLRRIAKAGVVSPTIAGVALPGPIDTTGQRVVGSAVLPGWAGCGAADIEAVLGLPVMVENDANLAALGEHTYGAGRGASNTLTVKFHSGVGAGLILNGSLVSGPRGGAGEIGHIEIDMRGSLCRCGKRGCLDTFSSVPAILDALRPHHDIETVGQLMLLLKAGEPGVRRVIHDAASMVGRVVAGASLLIAPERIIMVGSMLRAGEVVLGPVQTELQRHMAPDTHAVPEVVTGQLADAHTALGGVALALMARGWLD